jgi:hypothetical protein
VQQEEHHIMENSKQTSKQAPEPNFDRPRGIPYSQMTSKQKITYILKLAVCIVTFGMVFPNVGE